MVSGSLVVSHGATNLCFAIEYMSQAEFELFKRIEKVVALLELELCYV